MSDTASTLTQAAPAAPAPGPRFTDQVHAMTTQLALTSTITGAEHLISNLRRMAIPADLEHGHAETLNDLATVLQNLRNLQLVLTFIVERQTKEGSL